MYQFYGSFAIIGFLITILLHEAQYFIIMIGRIITKHPSYYPRYKDNLSISLIHPQASSHTFCLKRQVLTNFRAFFSSKLSNEILLKEKKRKIIGAVALCGTWLAGQEVVPAGEGRQPRQASQPCGVPALQAPASPANSPCD